MLILPGVVMCWLDRFVCRWKCTDEALMIRLASKVGGCREFGPEDAVVNRQPDKHGAIADGIERSPPQTGITSSAGFPTSPTISGGRSFPREHSLGSLRSPSAPSRSRCPGFILAEISDLRLATSGLRHSPLAGRRG